MRFLEGRVIPRKKEKKFRGISGSGGAAGSMKTKTWTWGKSRWLNFVNRSLREANREIRRKGLKEIRR